MSDESAFSPRLQQLMQALRCLPGVGPKSAQRMAFHLLERDRNGARQLAHALSEAVEQVGHCQRCRNFSEADVCGLCRNPGRDATQLCIVESPADVLVLEKAIGYRGLYFVLMGHLSPLDGIGPAELGLDDLARRLDEGQVQEVILATNPTVEGEATSHYLSEMARKRSIRATRLAHGVPLGGELEFLDGGTLSQAFADRRDVL